MPEGEYEIKESVRARHARITIHPDGRMIVTKPPKVSLRSIEKFIDEKRDWIELQRAQLARKRSKEPRVELPRPRRDSRAFKEAITAARTLTKERLEYFNEKYGFSYDSISIRNQKTRWGSCSAQNNLSFNYKIVYLPSELSDYIIVHELCHTKQHNHSERFWALVEKEIPNHLALRKALRTRYEF